MPLNLTHIPPGQLPEPVFDLLVKRAGITSVPVIAAVRDHLVKGHGKQESWLKHGANAGSFSTRTRLILDEAAKLDAELRVLLPFLIPDVQAEQLASAAQKVRSKLAQFQSLASGLGSDIQGALYLAGHGDQPKAAAPDGKQQD